MGKKLILTKNVVKKIITNQTGPNPAILPSNEGIDIIAEVQESLDDGTLVAPGGGGGGSTNLTTTRTNNSVTVVSDSGTDAVIPAATTSEAGVLTALDKQKLDALTNYTHPNHTGDVTSVGDGTTTISNNAVTTAKLADGAVTNQKVASGIDAVKIGSGNVSNAEFAHLDGVTSPLQTQINGKQPSLVFQEEGVDINTPNTINKVNFIGATVTATQSTDTLNVTINGSGGGGSTNISEGTRTSTTVQVLSDTGTDATLSPATSTLAGVMTAADKTKVDFVTVTQAVDLDAMESDVADLTSLSGVASNSVNLGTFTGTTIPDNQTIKQALQALETKTEAGDTVTNGLTGNGTAATPHKLGGTLIEATVIEGADNAFTLRNAGVINLESDQAASGSRTELVMTGNNVVGAYLRHQGKGTNDPSSQLSLDNDNTMGFTYQPDRAVSNDIGFKIVPSTTIGASKLRIDTPNNTLGTATTGQVLARQSDGTVEFVTPSGGGGTTIQEVETDNTIVVYRVISGTPVVTVSRTGGTQTISFSGGTIKIMSVATEGVTADLAGDNSFSIVVNGVIGTSKLAYPVTSKWNSSGSAPTTAVPHTQDIDNTPQVQVTNGTAGTSITIRAINMNAFTNWVLKSVW